MKHIIRKILHNEALIIVCGAIVGIAQLWFWAAVFHFAKITAESWIYGPVIFTAIIVGAATIFAVSFFAVNATDRRLKYEKELNNTLTAIKGQ